jgi:hypothetical protein
MDASVLLIKALGGGWDVAKLPQISSMMLIYAAQCLLDVLFWRYVDSPE